MKKKLKSIAKSQFYIIIFIVAALSAVLLSPLLVVSVPVKFIIDSIKKFKTHKIDVDYKSLDNVINDYENNHSKNKLKEYDDILKRISFVKKEYKFEKHSKVLLEDERKELLTLINDINFEDKNPEVTYYLLKKTKELVDSIDKELFIIDKMDDVKAVESAYDLLSNEVICEKQEEKQKVLVKKL